MPNLHSVMPGTNAWNHAILSTSKQARRQGWQPCHPGSMQPCRQIRNHATMQSCPLASNMQPCQQARRQASNRTKHASNQLEPCQQARRQAGKQARRQASMLHACMQSCKRAGKEATMPRRQASNRVTKHASNQLSQASQACKAGKQGGKQACCTHACNHASGQARKPPCTHAIKLCNQPMQSSRLASGQAGRQGSNHATMQSFRLPSTQPCNQAMQSNHATKPCNHTMQPNQAPKQDRKRACDHANEKATMAPWPTLTSPTYRQLVSTSQ
jgi:hypothetical protein